MDVAVDDDAVAVQYRAGLVPEINMAVFSGMPAPLIMLEMAVRQRS
jgi:hypothetical protein